MSCERCGRRCQGNLCADCLVDENRETPAEVIRRRRLQEDEEDAEEGSA